MSEPIEMYLYELRNDDSARRIDAIRNLLTVGQVLGPERSKDELIPYISDCLDDEDHVLLAFSEEIPKFVEFVGGEESAHCLLAPLEILANNEDSKVRSQSVKGIIEVALILSDKDIASFVLPLVTRLSSADWWTPRTSACGIISSIYPRVSKEDQEILKTTFFELCCDLTPMVRRSAFTGLGDFISVVEKDVVVGEILSIINRMAADSQDSVRLLTIETCIALSRVLDFEENQKLAKPIFIACATDLSWRVRYTVALNYHEAVKLLNPEYNEEFAKIFLNLLKDEEPEVRKATATNIPGMGQYLPLNVVIEELLPTIRGLTKDDKLQVRESLALSLTSLVEVLGEDNTKENLLELIEILLSDKESVVRLNVISTLPLLLKVVNITHVSRLILDAIEHLSSDSQWRIRLKIIEYIPNMSRQLGIDFFNENLLQLCLSWLEDSVYTVRIAAIDNLRNLSEIFGLDWSLIHVIPMIRQKSKSEIYLPRITSLFAIERFIDFVDAEVKNEFYEIVSEKLQDAVPNIRFNSCRLLKLFKDRDQSSLIPVLTEMIEDADPDVRFHAGKALKDLL